MSKNPILTIGITSYKRVNELIRCIKSISTMYVDELEILISEDHSPLSEEIKMAVEELKKKSIYNIRFTSNDVNLGYDMNLGSIIKKSNGQYIFFMSDDDAVCENCLDEIIEFLMKNDQYGVLWAPYIAPDTRKLNRYHKVNMSIPAGEKSAAKYLYDSILFSGLIFKKRWIEEFDSARFKNYNYFQVYMFLRMIYEHEGYYFCKPSVDCIMDGENAYGISESSGGNAILADRTSVKSNLEFNKSLFKVIRMFDDDEKTSVFKNFEKQYSLHAYSGLSIAREKGIKYFKEYYKILSELDIKKYPIVNCYYILLFVLGRKKADFLLAGLKRIAKKEWTV